MKYLIFALLYLVYFAQSQELSSQKKCLFRCIASCLHKDKSSLFIDCQHSCIRYDKPALCDASDLTCWDSCYDLSPSTTIVEPSNFTLDNNNGVTIIHWNPVSRTTFYVIQYKNTNTSNFDEDRYEIAFDSFLPNFHGPGKSFCDPFDVRVSAVNPDGFGKFTKSKRVESPYPSVTPLLQLMGIRYINEPFITDFYNANGTIEIMFSFASNGWPLGDEDIDVMPMFHLINCAEPDLSQSVPLPDFVKGLSPNTLVGRVGSDMMYRRCRFLYYIQSVSSRICGTVNSLRSPPSEDMRTLTISCDIVEDNPCPKVDSYEAPICGQINDIQYKVVDAHVPPKGANLTLNVTFDPIARDIDSPTIYYLAYYGRAEPYETKEQETFLGVNITEVVGETNNCLEFNLQGFCVNDTGNSVIVTGLQRDILYGITFCAVRDPRNLTVPNLQEVTKAFKPKADKILVHSNENKNGIVGLIIGVVVFAVVLLILGTMAIYCYINKNQRKQNKLYQLKLAQMEREKESRYIDLPKKQDVWEIERRNLIIHSEKKLGSGAFGAVYLGKILGKSLGHKDSHSPLGVNLMRAENCLVAVKMLPEYADDISRTEFMREIGLMKTLGYHERLVNMLACITESEPLCLIVEYCSDGDLLHFLRERCKYMMKLDNAGIDYHEPPIGNSYDIDMIITLKQLLMFAVQICYGLEYLSQKGFVHRDVAARNVLVHDKNCCKIGDFGLCRYIYSDSSHYRSKGGRLPLKWMPPESIRNYEFSTKSDVWSFGILLFEIITLGGTPYPGVQPEDMLMFLESGGRMEKPDNCPEEYYSTMAQCWEKDLEQRPEFSTIRQKLAYQLEEITEEYSYLKLDAQRDYYNVQYGEQKTNRTTTPEPSKTNNEKT